MSNNRIRTVRDYLQSDKEDPSLLFESPVAVTQNGSKVYSIPQKPNGGETWLKVRPSDSRQAAPGALETEPVGILLRQHLEDRVYSPSAPA